MPDTERPRKKSEFLPKEKTWLGQETIEHGTKPNTENFKALLQIKPPKSIKKYK